MNEGDVSVQDEYTQAGQQLDNLYQTSLTLDQGIAEEYERLWQAFVQRYPLLNRVPQVSLSETTLTGWLELHATARRA